MKTSNFALTAVAAALGVGGALQADRLLRRDAAPAFALRENAAPATVRRVLDTSVAAPVFDFSLAAEKASPSVVSVDRYERAPMMFDDGEGATSERETGTGSGVIVSADGTIVTNNHVISGIEPGSGRVTVRLADKRTFAAKIVGADPRSDLAVLKIQATGLTPIELASSSEVKVGQWVLAVGNPLGFDNTVSVGVVSSLKRDLPVGNEGLVAAIQTDAAINPGNSGGALTDAQGRLIGINTAIASSTGQSVGIGFAIPVDRVKKVTNDIVKYGAVRYAGLGLRYFPAPLDDPRARQYVIANFGGGDLPSAGLFVRETSGAAAAAGIRANDVLLKLDGEKVEGPIDLNRALLDRKPGDKVKVEYWSQGATKTTTVTLQELTTKL